MIAPNGGASARIRTLLPSLVPSEQRVAQVCLERAAEVVDWSVAELAAAAGTSTATVVRTCKSLGFKGFQQLRLMLARDGAPAPETVLFRPDAPVHEVAQAVFRTAAGSLDTALQTLDAEQTARAVEAIDAAGRLLIVGSGGSSPPAQEAALRFTAVGRPAEAPVDAYAQTLTARLLGPRDVCVAISHSGINSQTLAAARAAKEAGATVVGLTSFARSVLCEVADIALVAGFPDPSFRLDMVTSRIAHVLLLNAIEIAVAARREEAERSAAVDDVTAGFIDDRP